MPCHAFMGNHGDDTNRILDSEHSNIHIPESSKVRKHDNRKAAVPTLKLTTLASGANAIRVDFRDVHANNRNEE